MPLSPVYGAGIPLVLGHFKECLLTVGERLVGAKDPKFPLLAV